MSRMICPVCGSRLRVQNTETDGDITIRIYRCDSCQNRFISMETLSELQITKKIQPQYVVVVISNNKVNKDAVYLLSKYLPKFVKVYIKENDEHISINAKYNLYIYVDEKEVPKIAFKNRVYINSTRTTLDTIYNVIYNKLLSIGMIVDKRRKNNQVRANISDDGYISE